MGKRKYTGPPYAVGVSESVRIGAAVAELEVIRELGCKTFKDPGQVSNGNLRKFLEVHNPSAAENWVVVHLPDIDPSAIRTLPGFVELPVIGKNTDCYNWSMEAQIGRIRKRRMPKETEEAQLAPGAEPEGNESAPAYKVELKALCGDAISLASEGYPSTGVALDQIPGTGEGYAIDCEMCLAGQTQVLTRIAVVRFSDGAQLMDQLVKPEVPITDYVTQYSGITEEMLRDVTFTLSDVHEWLRQRIGGTDVLIGHSLHNDLNVLKVTHPHIVDTALVFPHYNGPSYHSSLKYLTKTILDQTIQQGSNNEPIGHNPVEDARACEKLVKWVLVHGIEYSRVDTKKEMALTTELLTYGVKSTIVAPQVPIWDADGTADHVVENDIEKIVNKTVQAVKNNHRFVCATIQESDSSRLRHELSRLIDQLPYLTLVTILLGTNYPLRSEIQHMRQRKTQYSKDFRTKSWDAIEDPWTSEDDTRLRATISQLGRGTVFTQYKVDKDARNEWPLAIKKSFNKTMSEEADKIVVPDFPRSEERRTGTGMNLAKE